MYFCCAVVQHLPIPGCCADTCSSKGGSGLLAPQAATSASCSPSLFFHPRVAEEATRHLNLTQPNLLQRLTQALSQSHTSDM